MNYTRKEHTVPQTHIKNFSYKLKNTNKVIVIDKKINNPYPSNVEDVACQRDFYEVKDKETNFWEKWYCTIEDDIPNIYNAIIINSRFASNGKCVLSEYLKQEMSKIIVIQLTRTKSSKEYIKKVGYSLTSKFINDVKVEHKNHLTSEQISILNKYEKNEDFVFSSALEHLNSNKFQKKAINILMNKIWIVHKNLNYKTIPFVSSDNPVILYNIYTRKYGFGNNGLLREDTIIYYAINKELLIAIYPNLNSLNKYNNKIDFMNDNKFVMNFNKANYIECNRQVFYSFDETK